jgi:hypothetical protein
VFSPTNTVTAVGQKTQPQVKETQGLASLLVVPFGLPVISSGVEKRQTYKPMPSL